MPHPVYSMFYGVNNESDVLCLCFQLHDEPGTTSPIAGRCHDARTSQSSSILWVYRARHWWSGVYPWRSCGGGLENYHQTWSPLRRRVTTMHPGKSWNLRKEFFPGLMSRDHGKWFLEAVESREKYLGKSMGTLLTKTILGLWLGSCTSRSYITVHWEIISGMVVWWMGFGPVIASFTSQPFHFNIHFMEFCVIIFLWNYFNKKNSVYSSSCVW